MNLPNAITVARIAATPLIALLPFVPSWWARLLAFTIFLAAAITDYYDGMLARTRGLITDLGKQLDPIADKALLVATLVPMFMLMGAGLSGALLHSSAGSGPTAAVRFPFVTPIGLVTLPWWILVVVLGRELFMTVFRQAAARRGVVIAAIGPAKWKTTFQLIWVGAAFFWFFAATLAGHRNWTSGAWNVWAHFNGIVGSLAMVGAVVLTLYSLVLYMQRYGGVLFGSAGRAGAG